MKTSVPWQVRGIRTEARETAREAARRAGMSVGDWLNTVIVESAIDYGVLPEDIERLSEDGDLASINQRLNRLTHQLEMVISGSRGEFLAGTPSDRSDPPPAPPQDDARSMDEAIAEIAARQRALEADFVASPSIEPRQAESPRPPANMPASDISGLEQQLQHITKQIELFNRPSGLEDAVAGLRKELTQIGRTLTEAMPKRAVEAIESELRAVAQRLDQSRQCGVDPKAITAIERALVEVRDALRSLTPAEKLVGYGDAINALSSKIEQISTKQDPAALQQLESAIGAMRNIVSHVASNEALTLLAEEVRGLSARIDRIDTPGGASVGAEAISSLDRRIGALSEQLNTSASVTSALPPQFEAMLKRYSERFDQAQSPRGDAVAVNQLEDRIVNLAQKLDASDARFSHLAGIERGLSDLLLHIDELRSSKPDAGGEPAIPPVVDALQRDVARTKNSLEDIHGTLGHVVDRLATIEADIRRPAAAPAAMPASASSTPAKPAASQIERQPIEPNLPPDYPLEPGSGGPRSANPATAADRIAASEAALGAARPAAAPQASQPNFIAAARRAAQAANSGNPASTKSDAPEKTAGSVPGTGQLSKRLRSLFVGVSVIVIVLGGLRIATNLLDQSNEAKIEAPASKDAPPPTNSEAIPAPKKPGTQSTLAPAELKPVAPAPALAPAAKSEPEKLPVPSFDGGAPRTPDVTGALPQSAPSLPVPAPATPVPASIPAPSGPDKLPSALRAAAAAGDPAAAYEIGVRYFDGRGIPANPEEAARWLEKAAKAELAPAQFRLGSLYEKGQGVKKDLEAARKLYLAASDKGNAKSMHNLAVLYAEGIEGKPDYRTAAVWFRKGADHGITDSQYNLGILYARGIGVDRNLAESFKWFSLAAAGGDRESIRKRDEIASRLDPQSLTAARQAADTWTALPQPDEAVNVKAPAGGWDQVDGPPAKKPRGVVSSKTGQP